MTRYTFATATAAWGIEWRIPEMFQCQFGSSTLPIPILDREICVENYVHCLSDQFVAMKRDRWLLPSCCCTKSHAFGHVVQVCVCACASSNFVVLNTCNSSCQFYARSKCRSCLFFRYRFVQKLWENPAVTIRWIPTFHF